MCYLVMSLGALTVSRSRLVVGAPKRGAVEVTLAG